MFTDWGPIKTTKTKTQGWSMCIYIEYRVYKNHEDKNSRTVHVHSPFRGALIDKMISPPAFQKRRVSLLHSFWPKSDSQVVFPHAS
jgi:hypothetical protein